MNRRGAWRGTGSVLVLATLAGCAGMPGQQAAPPAASATSAAADAPAPRAEAPSVKAPPTPGGGSPSPDMLKAPPKGQGKVLTVNGDLSCERLVVPYTLTDNLDILKGLGLDGFFQALKQVFDSIVQGTSASLAAKTAGKSAKHGIPYHLRAAAYQMNWVPMDLEVAYGEHLAGQLEEAGQLEPKDSEVGTKLYAKAQRLLDETLAGVDAPHDYNFRVLVTTKSGQNAQALPGGLVLVDPDLLENPKLARKARFAMAHEVGHVLQRHQTRAMQARIIDAVSLRGSLPELAKVMGESKRSPRAVITLALAGKLQFEKFFVEQELHSDGCAVRILNRTQPSSTELIRVVQDFLSLLPKPLQTHKHEPKAQEQQATAKTAVATVQQGKVDSEALIDLVTRPIERHPTDQERTKNLKHTLDKLREETRPAPAPKKDGTRPANTPSPGATPKAAAPKAADLVKKPPAAPPPGR